MFEQAALGLGLVVVPLYVNDRPGNVAYILNDADVRLLLLENPSQWRELQGEVLPPQLQIWSLERCADEHVRHVDVLLSQAATELITCAVKSDALATIIYTSGTTGRPKGVMLSHANILWNAHAGIRAIAIHRSDLFLSFLPLSHALERTIGYYLPMMAGASVAYARSIQLLAQDLEISKPTVLIWCRAFMNGPMPASTSSCRVHSSASCLRWRWSRDGVVFRQHRGVIIGSP
jgi:long-chain acyl-CoA synthetase